MLFSNEWDGGVRLTTKQTSKRAILVCILSFGSFGLPVAGADSPAATEASDTRAVSSSEIQELKRMLLDQQRQIDELRQALAGQRKPVEAAAPPALRTTGEVAG